MINTQVNKIELTILYERQTISAEVKPEGAITIVHTQTPISQLLEISSEDRRRMTLMIKGILKNGKMMAAHKEMFFMSYVTAKNLTRVFMRSSTSRMDREAVLAMPKPCTLKEARVVA